MADTKLSDLTAAASVAGANLIYVVQAGTPKKATLTVLTTLLGASFQPLNANLTDIAGLADPNADRLVFWDDSAGHLAYLTAGSGLTITGTTITAAVGTPGGSANDVQTNDGAGGFAGSGLVWDGSLLTAGNAATLGAGGGVELRAANDTGLSVVRVGQSSTRLGYFAWFYNATASLAYLGFATYGGNNPIVLFSTEGQGNVGIGAAFSTVPLARLHIATDNAAAIGVIVQAATTQSVDIQQWQDVSGTVLASVSAAGVLTGAAQAHRPVNAQTGTTYSFVLTDADKCVSGSNASAITWTVPTNASVAFPVNTEIDLVQLGAGQITLAAAGGVTLNSYQSKVAISGQYAGATLKKLGTNTWILIGNLA